MIFVAISVNRSLFPYDVGLQADSQTESSRFFSKIALLAPSPPLITRLIRTVCLLASSSCPLLPHLLKPQMDLPSHLFPPRHQPWDFAFWSHLQGSFLFTSSYWETHATSFVHLFSPSMAFSAHALNIIVVFTRQFLIMPLKTLTGHFAWHRFPQ